jgi:LDH2 family malate/lactate/ureidoglycolate dehydrogenase
MAGESGDVARTVGIEALRSCLQRALERLEMPSDHAAGLAGLLVDNELRGHPDHGAAMLHYLKEVFQAGRYNPRPKIETISESDSALLLEGDFGVGTAATGRAMAWCVERARARRGVAMAGVRHWQFITGGYYVRLATDAGLIGLACLNSTPMVAPPVGRQAAYGTNPFAYGVPAASHPPIILDMSTTNAAALKMRLAAQTGSPVAPNLVLDRAGEPSTSPFDFLEGGTMAPLGFPAAPHKGFALGLLVDTLGGVLTGAGFSLGVAGERTDNGAFLMAIDPEGLMPREQFMARVDQQVAMLKSAERREGAEALFMPGERSHQRQAELRARGVAPLSEASWRALSSSCEGLGVPLPESVD